jgi:predicted P-loop ATPase
MALEEKIKNMTSTDLLNTENLNSLYDTQPETERERLKSLMIMRAKELKVLTPFKNVIKKYDVECRKNDITSGITTPLDYLKSELKLDDNYKILKTIDNFLYIMQNDTYFERIFFNLFTGSPEIITDKKILPLTDTDESELKNYIEKTYKLYDEKKFINAFRIFLKDKSYHPIKYLIESNVWDKVERIPTLLIKWLGIEDNPYNRELSRLIFSGGINRLYNPGCKFDEVVILIGEQGSGKSTFIRWLAIEDCFFKEVNELEGQKGVEALSSGWICELGELLALTKAKEVEAIKSYISRQVDNYRLPYDRYPTDHKRQCIFIGSTNRKQFLTDKTGNRRFYPIQINQNANYLYTHEAEIKADILQCWLEAKAKYDKGELLPYADPKLKAEIQAKQSQVLEDDYRIELIQGYLEDKYEVCILGIWKQALHNEYINPTRKESNEIALILQSMPEWERADKPKRFKDIGQAKYWIKKFPFVDSDNLPY